MHVQAPVVPPTVPPLAHGIVPGAPPPPAVHGKGGHGADAGPPPKPGEQVLQSAPAYPDAHAHV